jgi:hypothetical protein
VRGAIARLVVGSALAAVAMLPPRATPADEASAGSAPERAWYVPDHAKLQLAGNIGFLSPGVGYAFARDRLEADLFLGWVPEAIGGEDLFSVTAKLTWLPWTADVQGWRLRPVTVGLQLTRTFGKGFFVLEPDEYPRGYHMLPTALRAGLCLGGVAGKPAWGLEQVGFYYELVALDVMLAFWTTNRALGFADVFSLALGARVEF